MDECASRQRNDHSSDTMSRSWLLFTARKLQCHNATNGGAQSNFQLLSTINSGKKQNKKQTKLATISNEISTDKLSIRCSLIATMSP